MKNGLVFFQASPGGRDVIEKFINRDLKKLRPLQLQLIDQLKVLQSTPITTLRETGRIEHVDGEIFSYRFRSEFHWVRLLLGFWPGDSDVVILVPLLKKQNTLDRDDIDQATKNLRIYKAGQ
jgi:hypothetical protein